MTVVLEPGRQGQVLLAVEAGFLPLISWRPIRRLGLPSSRLSRRN